MADWRGDNHPRREVTIAEHQVKAGPARMLTVPHTETRLGASSAKTARLQAILAVHRDNKIPPWKPCVRESWPDHSADWKHAEPVG